MIRIAYQKGIDDAAQRFKVAFTLRELALISSLGGVGGAVTAGEGRRGKGALLGTLGGLGGGIAGTLAGGAAGTGANTLFRSNNLSQPITNAGGVLGSALGGIGTGTLVRD